jgi:hypothetical protein
MRVGEVRDPPVQRRRTTDSKAEEMTMAQPLTAEEVRAILTEAGVDYSQLTITDDPAVWTSFETGASGRSVLVEGPEDARRAAHDVLFAKYFAVAPYPECDYWHR